MKRSMVLIKEFFDGYREILKDEIMLKEDISNIRYFIKVKEDNVNTGNEISKESSHTEYNNLIEELSNFKAKLSDCVLNKIIIKTKISMIQMQFSNDDLVALLHM